LEKEIPVIILAGGKSTPHSSDTSFPDVLKEVAGKPIIVHIISYLQSYGFANITVYLCKHKELIKSKVNEHFSSIKFLEDSVSRGTASGLLKLSEQDSVPDKFILIYGDNLFHVDFTKMIALHDQKEAVGTMALTEIDQPESYGTVAFLDGNVFALYEKMSQEELQYRHITRPFRINAGHYVFDKRIFSYLKTFLGQEKVSLERDVLPLLIEDKKLAGHADSGLYVDIENPLTYTNTIAK